MKMISNFEIKEEWMKIGSENSKINSDSFHLILERTIDHLEEELCKILSPPKTIKENSLPKIQIDQNLNLKETLKKISLDPELKNNFEKNLKKN